MRRALATLGLLLAAPSTANIPRHEFKQLPDIVWHDPFYEPITHERLGRIVQAPTNAKARTLNNHLYALVRNPSTGAYTLIQEHAYSQTSERFDIDFQVYPTGGLDATQIYSWHFPGGEQQLLDLHIFTARSPPQQDTTRFLHQGLNTLLATGDEAKHLEKRFAPSQREFYANIVRARFVSSSFFDGK